MDREILDDRAVRFRDDAATIQSSYWGRFLHSLLMTLGSFNIPLLAILIGLGLIEIVVILLLRLGVWRDLSLCLIPYSVEALIRILIRKLYVER